LKFGSVFSCLPFLLGLLRLLLLRSRVLLPSLVQFLMLKTSSCKSSMVLRGRWMVSSASTPLSAAATEVEKGTRPPKGRAKEAVSATSGRARPLGFLPALTGNRVAPRVANQFASISISRTGAPKPLQVLGARRAGTCVWSLVASNRTVSSTIAATSEKRAARRMSRPFPSMWTPRPRPQSLMLIRRLPLRIKIVFAILLRIWLLIVFGCPRALLSLLLASSPKVLG